MTRILGISGSLRAGSFNTALLRAAQAVADAPVELEIATLHGIPLYDGDLEQRDGLPAAVTAFPASSRTRSTGCRARRATFRGSSAIGLSR